MRDIHEMREKERIKLEISGLKEGERFKLEAKVGDAIVQGMFEFFGISGEGDRLFYRDIDTKTIERVLIDDIIRLERIDYTVLPKAIDLVKKTVKYEWSDAVTRLVPGVSYHVTFPGIGREDALFLGLRPHKNVLVFIIVDVNENGEYQTAEIEIEPKAVDVGFEIRELTLKEDNNGR